MAKFRQMNIPLNSSTPCLTIDTYVTNIPKQNNINRFCMVNMQQTLVSSYFLSPKDDWTMNYFIFYNHIITYQAAS